jgi:hypothetical protein
MALSIISQVAECRIDATKFSDLIKHLVEEGYQALLSEAKSKFLAVLGGVGSGRLVEAESDEDEYYMYRSFASARRIRYPIAGDIFIDSKSSGVLYLALFGDDRTIAAPRREKSASKQLEVDLSDRAREKMPCSISLELFRYGSADRKSTPSSPERCGRAASLGIYLQEKRRPLQRGRVLRSRKSPLQKCCGKLIRGLWES